MSRRILLIPTGSNVGLTSIILGVVKAMEKKCIQLSVFKPISQSCITGNNDQTIAILRLYSELATIVEPLKIEYVESLLTASKKDVLMEEIVARYHEQSKNVSVVLIEGLVPTSKHSFAQSLNYDIAKTLGAEIVFVTAPGNSGFAQMSKRLELVRNEFGGQRNKNIIGVILNKVNAPVYEQGRILSDLSEIFNNLTKSTIENLTPNDLESLNLPVLASIPWNFDLLATRAFDIAKHLGAIIVNEGEVKTRRIKSVTFCARSILNMLKYFSSGSLLVTSADRVDVLVSVSLAAMNGVKIGALLLTGGYNIEEPIRKLCDQAFKTGLPVFMVKSNTWQTSLNLQHFSLEIPVDDYERINKNQQYVARHISSKLIDSLVFDLERPHYLSPPAFRYQLTELARKAGKRIVLPEGDEPRIVKAASICAERGIATCVLLGNPTDILRVAFTQDIKLGSRIELVDPITIREKYIARLIELRKSKGMTEVVARKQITDRVVLGTLMLEKGDVDGLVSGVVHTTANTIRPSLQLIKTAAGSTLVSSVFFMLLPEQVLVYGDCAINPDPTAEELSEIAIQSADSAKAFGIEPRVAMISYSTGNSGAGSDVEKVCEATRLAQEKRPDLIIDGPLQYDAAVMADVAKSKASNSPVAGKATVFIFPDLNTGNTTYKAVQRSADLVSIGPMLQGMRKPVNDLSRGALVDDIVYTVALTAIQAEKNETYNDSSK